MGGVVTKAARGWVARIRVGRSAADPRNFTGASCAALPNRLCGPAGVDGACNPERSNMATAWFQPIFFETGRGRRRIGREDGRGTFGSMSGQCPVRDCRRARGFRPNALNSRDPSRGGASIDGDDRVSPAELGFGGECGSNLLSGAGLAQIRGQAQVAAALAQMAAGCGMCNRRIFLRRNSPTGVSKTRG